MPTYDLATKQNSASKPSNSYTVEQFIALGRGVSITYDAFSYKEILSNGTESSVLNVINDYLTEINDYVVEVHLDNDEYRKYRYKPKLLCNDIYGNPELYYIILLLNGMIDVKEFTLTTVKMLRKDDMNTILSAIYNAERKYIDNYNTSHGTN